MLSEISPQEKSDHITILVIDDDKEDRRYWSGALRNCHYTVLEADSGESGFILFREHAVSCVVLELDMPESGVFTLLRLIPDCKRPVVPVVILTRLMNRALFELVKHCGAHGCLVKHHCSTEELTRNIQEAMASVKSREGGA